MCPRCRSSEVHRSRSWRVRDFMMVLWGMKPFRCEQCNKRFYLPSRLEQGIEAEHQWLESVRSEKTHGRHRHHHRS